MRAIIAVLIITLCVHCAFAQEPAKSPDSERIVSPEELRDATRPRILPLRILGYPHRAITDGMEKGLIKFEKNRMRERLRSWNEKLARLGIAGLFGGLGEGTGFGGGASYTIRPSSYQSLRFLGRATIRHYEEADFKWTINPPGTEISFESSYQWRPRENFYGLGQ